jgi:hypothetical protein
MVLLRPQGTASVRFAQHTCCIERSWYPQQFGGVQIGSYSKHQHRRGTVAALNSERTGVSAETIEVYDGHRGFHGSRDSPRASASGILGRCTLPCCCEWMPRI